MKKKEFLEELKEHLIGVPKEDKIEILQDYEEHFRIGKKKKRSEAEISKSLGNPKIIARDIRKELSKTTTKEELKSEAIETWVATKKLAKHIFQESRDSFENFIQNEKNNLQKGKCSYELWVILGLILFAFIFQSGFFILVALVIGAYSILKYTKRGKGKKIKSSKRKKKEKSSLKIVLSLLFNLLFVVWFWLALLGSMIGFLIGSIAIIIAGAIIIAFSIFALISYQNHLTKDILFSILFAGIGTTILGGLFTNLFEKLIKLFFILTKKYVELNRRFIEKWE